MEPFHEFYRAAGQPHQHQQMLADYLSRCDPATAASLARAVRTRLVEQEVTFNPLGSPAGSGRAWTLDEIPHIIAAQEFRQISEGLAARARLFSACLEDIYGPQRLLREHIIPPHVILENPRYYRPLHGVVPIGGQRLVFYAADLVRDPAGNYLVHSDRTATPSGAGYALENRLTIGQVHDQLFRDYRVRKLNSFFSMIGGALESLHPRQGNAPRIVLLTPGQHDESSFEHGYLARYQGLELVEGRDLTVRGDVVYLKTLEGLKRVDVILRRLVDDWCDPLELREDSSLGVAGLVSAVRAGSVGIANPLGSAIVETPAFRAYLPEIAQALTGTDIGVPSVPTRYLGDPRHLQEVLDTWAEWTIRPAFNDRRELSSPNGKLSPDASVQLRKKVTGQAHSFVAEKSPIGSVVPLGMGLQGAVPLGVRLFACFNGSDYMVMPGGLARANASTDGLFLPEPDGATSKDLWVLGEKDAEKPAPPRMPEPPVEIRRGGIDLPSRLFDDIFWLGRYAERCDGSGRLIRQALEPITMEGQELTPEVARAIRAALVTLRLSTAADAKETSLEKVLMSATYDVTRPDSVRGCLRAIHSLTTSTRSRLSADTWKILRRLTQERDDAAPVDSKYAIAEIEEILMNLSAYRGLVGSNMVRGHGWLFLEIGRRIERAVYVLTLIIHLFSTGESRLLMETLLRVCDSLLTYRSRYLSTLQPMPVVDLVLTDNTNPQSVLFQVRRLLWCVRRLPHERKFPLSRAEQRLITLEASLMTADLDQACHAQAKGVRALAEECINLLWQVSDDIAKSYFTHADLAHSMDVSPGLTMEEGGTA